jgi:hypothetical protein
VPDQINVRKIKKCEKQERLRCGSLNSAQSRESPFDHGHGAIMCDECGFLAVTREIVTKNT